MQKPELVIFDFDDTLLHLDIDWSSVKAEVLEMAEQEGLSFSPGDHLVPLSNRISVKPELKGKVDGIFLRHETECVSNRSYEVFQGMPELLAEISSNSMKMAIASGNHSRTINEILSQLDLLRHFDLVCGRDKVRQNKPAPDQLLLILDQLNIDKDQALFTGDSMNDEAAAQAAGVRYVKAEAEKTVELLRALLL